MSVVLAWGKPKVEFAPSSLTAITVWTSMPAIKEDTAKLTPTKGAKTEAKEEGGGVVASKTAKNTYVFELEVFVNAGATRPIADNDGVIVGDFAVRLTPENVLGEGFLIDNSTASVEESWNSKDGKMLKYTFDVLVPPTGKSVKPYTAP